MTRDRARKRAIRARMAATGEPYSVAARQLLAPEQVSPAPASPEPVSAGSASPGDTLQAVIACANRTLAAPSARIEFRIEWEFPAMPPRRPPGFAGRLARRAARAAWDRFSPDVDAAAVRDAFVHQVSVGYLEPAADRYMVNSVAYAEMRVGGQDFGGRPGAQLQRRHQHRAVAEPEARDPAALLRLLQAATGATYTGEETLRETACQSAAVTSGPAGLAVLTDGTYVRRVKITDLAPVPQGTGVSKSWTLELWDFGVPVEELDWSHLPSFVISG